MKRIIFLAVSVLSFVTWASSAVGEESQRVLRDDCHLSFLVPKNVEYVEVDGAVLSGKDECYIAFKYTGDLRVKGFGRVPAMPEDWRAMTDFSLTVKAVPIANSLAQIESDDGAPQNGLFKVISQEHVSLRGGELYIVNYVAKNPTKNMVSKGETRETILVSGNSARSIVFQFYPGDRPGKAKKKKAQVFMDLFSSFQFSN